jgi:hypothetical protein
MDVERPPPENGVTIHDREPELLRLVASLEDQGDTDGERLLRMNLHKTKASAADRQAFLTQLYSLFQRGLLTFAGS